MSKVQCLFLDILMLACISGFASAQSGKEFSDYPNKPIRVIAPLAAGGGTDIAARLMSTELSKTLGVPVVVENRAGGDGIVGTETVVRAAPDGYVLLFAFASHTTTPFTHDTVPYDVEKDLTPITLMTVTPVLLLVNPSLPVTTVSELVQYVRTKPGGTKAGHAGSVSQLATEIFRIKTGNVQNIISVPYKGGAQLVVAILSGEVDSIFTGIGTVMSQIKSGKLRVIATATPKRLSDLPQIPTLAEGGVPGIEVFGWQGMLAPSKTPVAIVNKLNGAFVKFLKVPEVRERLLAAGFEPVGSTPDEFRAMIKRQLEEYGPIIRGGAAKTQ